MGFKQGVGFLIVGVLGVLGCSSEGDGAVTPTPPAATADSMMDPVTANTGGSDATGASGGADPSAVGGMTMAGAGGTPMTDTPAPDTAMGAGDAGVGEEPMEEVEPVDEAFAACVAELTPECGYDQKQTACAALITTEIPLSDGGTWGNNVIMGGPYGAFVEWNAGEDFRNPTSPLEDTCPILAGTFGEPQSVTDDVLDLRGADLGLYTIFRPACMKEGETYPVISWGNGTCGQSGGYAALLAMVASHGFVVVAPNSRFTAGGNNEMIRALDLAEALNADESSIFYQKLDMTRVGAMGHSQGSSATATAASDPRIKALILWNGGLTGSKPYLAVSGDRDIGEYTPGEMDDAIQGSSQPAAWLYYHKVLETGGGVTGHLTLMEQPERVFEPAVAWWKYMLNGDEEAKAMFVGDDCGLCGQDDEFEFGANDKLP